MFQNERLAMKIKQNNPDSRRYQGKTLFRMSDPLRKDFKHELLYLDLTQQSVLLASITLFVFYRQQPEHPLNKPLKKYFDRLVESAEAIEDESRRK